MGWFRNGTLTGALILVAALAGELAARFDDRLFADVPLLANTSFNSLFYSLDDGIRRGHPGARWKKVQFNNLGMRGPDLGLQPAPRCERWLFLGASETFGEPSIQDGDFPSRLRDLLPPGRCIEIANSASPGLNLRTVTEQFEAYLHQLRADVVFIYPPTQFYLTQMLPRKAPSPKSLLGSIGQRPLPAVGPHGPRSLVELLDSSRLLERVRDSAEVPAPIQRLRLRRWIDAALAEHPADWPYTAVPAEQLDALEADLEYLVRRIRDTGATPIILSHAVRSSDPPRPEDMEDLFAIRTYVPRAPAEVFSAFEYAAAARTRKVAKRLNVQLIDSAARLSGRRAAFNDAVHFSSLGNKEMAVLIWEAMSETVSPGIARAVQ